MPAFDDIANDPPKVKCSSFPSSSVFEPCPHMAVDIQPFCMSDLLETARDPNRWMKFFQLLYSAYLDNKNWDSVLALGNEDAQVVINALQASLDMTVVRKQDTCFRQALYLLVKLVEKTQRLPESLSIRGILRKDQESYKRGGFADIYRGAYQDTAVAIKRLLFSETKRLHNEKAFYREALVWRQLDHEHVLQFIGIDEESFPQGGRSNMCMISPWMPRGTLHGFIGSEDYYAEDDCYRLMGEIASALVYLHSYKVVHGDIHPANILIDADKHAKLADFGLSIVGDKTQGRMSSASDSAGAAHYLAPACVNETPDCKKSKRRSTAGDVYAFGCICFFLHEHEHPFHDLDDRTVAIQFFLGKRPDRPQGTEPELTDHMWLLIEHAWAQIPEERPTIRDIESRFALFAGSPSKKRSRRSYSFESEHFLGGPSKEEGWELVMRE